MARTVNYPKRAEKIKEMIDDLASSISLLFSQRLKISTL